MKPAQRRDSSSGDVAKTPRSAARLAAVQALYQMEFGGLGTEAVLREFLHDRLGHEGDEEAYADADPELFARIVRGVAGEREELDDMIAAVLSDDHDVDRLETLLRIVMRAGVLELSRHFDIPARVTLNEYVDIADAFYDRRGTGLVNAVLDRVGRALRAEELEEMSGGRTPLAG
jgi:transcription antitermination protein NusB